MNTAIDSDNVHKALEDILSSPKFANSPQMSAFLDYVVKETLDGDPSRIKAYTIAIDGLGKPDTFDPQQDPSIRVLAKRLRDSLEAYYAENQDTKVIISIRSGSYVPKFIPRAEIKPNFNPIITSTTFDPLLHKKCYLVPVTFPCEFTDKGYSDRPLCAHPTSRKPSSKNSGLQSNSRNKTQAVE